MNALQHDVSNYFAPCIFQIPIILSIGQAFLGKSARFRYSNWLVCFCVCACVCLRVGVSDAIVRLDRTLVIIKKLEIKFVDFHICHRKA